MAPEGFLPGNEAWIQILQGMTLIDEATLNSWPRVAWHPETRPSLHSWLAEDFCETDQNRLGCIGNIVMPDVAMLGLQLLGHHEGVAAS